MGTHAAIAVGLILYVVLTTAVSFFVMPRVRKPADYLVAGRGLPFWVLTGTIIGTCIGTGVIIGGSGLAYQHGWAGCAYPIGLGLGTLLTGLCFAKMRRYKFMTLSEEVACYYDGNRMVMEFSSISLFLSQLCWLTVQIMGGATVVGVVTGLPHGVSVVLAGFAKALISIPGGLKAVVYTDVLQTIILFCGFGCLAHSALSDAGGLAGLRQTVPADYFSFLGIGSLGGWNVLSLILVLISNPIADPGRRLTMYSAQTEAGAKWSMVAVGGDRDDVLGRDRDYRHVHLPSQPASSPRGSSTTLVGDECPAALAGGLCGGGDGFGNVLCGQRHRRRCRHVFCAAYLSIGERALSQAPRGSGALGLGVRVFYFHRAGALHGKHCWVRESSFCP